MAIDSKDVAQMINLFNVDCKVENKSSGSLFIINDFGVQVVFEVDHHKVDNDWWNVFINRDDVLEEKRIELLWCLVKGGYFHYLRFEYPNTFKKMLSLHNYDRLLIEKRLEVFGDKPKYNYLRELNKAYKGYPPSMAMSTDPGFYDFILE